MPDVIAVDLRIGHPEFEGIWVDKDRLVPTGEFLRALDAEPQGENLIVLVPRDVFRPDDRAPRTVVVARKHRPSSHRCSDTLGNHGRKAASGHLAPETVELPTRNSCSELRD
jgi:hypothetical protein